MPQLMDEQTALVGKESPARPAPYAVNHAMARFWCEMVEDPNPIYFDEDYARSTWLEAPFAPPAMLFTWGMQPVWPEEVRHESMIARVETLPALSLPLTLRRAIQAVAGTRDYYPFHHDEQFARENGAEGIFFNTMFLQAFGGRCATDWFGNDAFLRRLEIAMRASNYVGRTLTVDAAVANVRQEDDRRLVDVEGTLLTEDGPTTGVKWVIEVQA